MKTKRMVVISDLHCGSLVGLTPKGFESVKPSAKKSDFYKMRVHIWKFYKSVIDALQPIDVLLVNGDCIDGRGEWSGGLELLHADRQDQVDMAVACIREARAKKIVMSYGTGAHTGKYEDWENQIARDVGAKKIGGEDNIMVNKWIINYRHHVGRSSVPYGRHTPVAKENLINLLWADRGEYPRADIIVRSHNHYFAYAGADGWLAIATPALQGYGTRLGARRMSGTVDIGLIAFDFPKKTNGEAYKWSPFLMKLKLKGALVL